MKNQPLWKLLGILYKPHPWHGVSPGDGAPAVLQSFVEVVPTDTVKYEIDKVSGYLKLDRPQKFSSICPALYGFVPQTLCAERVAEFSSQRTGRVLQGDGDPLDICILTDRPVHHGNLLVECIPIGGFRMIDQDEADDKIIAAKERRRLRPDRGHRRRAGTRARPAPALFPDLQAVAGLGNIGLRDHARLRT
jgi:inorganic pyrophosphatase